MEALLVIDTDFNRIGFAAYDAATSPGELNLIGRGHVALVGADIEFLIKVANNSHPEIARTKPADGAFDHEKALTLMFNWLDRHCGLRFTAIGHRLAHAGEQCPLSVLLTDAVLDALESQPLQGATHRVKAMRFLRERLPGVPQAGCFDAVPHFSLLRAVPPDAGPGPGPGPAPAPAAMLTAINEKAIAASTLRCTAPAPASAVILPFPAMAPAAERKRASR